MKWLSRLFAKKPAAQMLVPQKPEPKRAEAVYLTETVTFGMHPYRSAEEDSSVYFVDENRGIRRKLIDRQGGIQDFPGMVKEDFWVKHVAPRYLQPQVRFRSSFEKRDKGWIFKWQLQPDGWYWADEGGFGGEDDWEVVLYTFVDLDGRFTGPFRIYQLGETGYAMDRFTGSHARSMKQALEASSDEEDHRSCADDLFPQLLGAKVEHISDRFYQLRDREEALAYWSDPVLSRDLKVLAQALLDAQKPLWRMAGRDQGRVKGCMTLFYLLTGEPVFKQVLDKFFGGKLDEYTVNRLNETA